MDFGKKFTTQMILERAKVKVLLVFLGDWNESKRLNYLELLDSVNAITVSDGSVKDDPFHAQFREGRIYYDFITSYYHDELREMELHRVLFGVWGLIDCSSETDTSKLISEFQANTLKVFQIHKYQQTSLFKTPVVKLVGFNSEVNHKDLTMIPTIGDPTPKLKQVVDDFTFDLIGEFGLLVIILINHWLPDSKR